MLFGPTPFTQNQLADDFRRLGLAPGDNIIMHSSLKSIGPVTHGAETVVEALLSVIAPGNLMVPTFTYSLPGWKADPFDVHNTLSRTGGITNYIRGRPDAIRSVHPSHSVAVLGPDAHTLTTNHLDHTALGEGSPFDRMRQRDASILMLGTSHDTNSTIHLCEVLSGHPYIDTGFTENQDFELAWYLNKNEQVTFAQLKQIPGCSRGFPAAGPVLDNAGAGRTGTVGRSSARLYKMSELVDILVPFIRSNPAALLCESYTCAICPRRRAFISGDLPTLQQAPWSPKNLL